MREALVRDVMSTDVVTVSPDTPVKEIAELMLEKDIGGVPVLDEDGTLIGIVTEEDLIMQDVRVHFPTYVQLLDAFIYLGGLRRFDEEIKKATGAVARDVMTSDVRTIGPGATVEDAATRMVDDGISRLPVVEEGRVTGIVTKRDLLQTLARE